MRTGENRDDRRPELGTAWHIESAGQHADHSVMLIVQRDGRPDHRGVGAEARDPRTITQESDPWRVWHVVFLTERPAERGRDTQRFEETRRHAGRRHPLRRAAVPQPRRPRGRSHGGGLTEAMALVKHLDGPVGELQDRQMMRLIGSPAHYQSRGIVDGERPEQHAVDERKDRAVGANRQGEGDDVASV